MQIPYQRQKCSSSLHPNSTSPRFKQNIIFFSYVSKTKVDILNSFPQGTEDINEYNRDSKEGTPPGEMVRTSVMSNTIELLKLKKNDLNLL